MSDDFRYRVGFDTDTSGLDQAQESVEQLDQSLQDLSDVEIADAAFDALRTKADELESELQGTARAVQAIGEQLGEGFDSARVEGLVNDLRDVGVSFDQIEQHARDAADVIERVDGIKLDAVNSGLTNVDSSMRRLSASGDQSRSVLANLVGNTAQDLGELGGVAGSAGVAIGQLAEYAADGNISLQNFAKIVGPLLAVGAATAGIAESFRVASDVMGRSGRIAETLRDQMDGLDVTATDLLETFKENKEALELPEDVTVSWGDYVNVLQEIVHLGDGFSKVDVAGILDKANVSLATFARLIEESADAGRTYDQQLQSEATFVGELQAALDAGLITQTEFNAAYELFGQLHDQTADAQREATRQAQLFAAGYGEITDALNETTASQRDVDLWWNNLLVDMADGVIQTDLAVNAWNNLRDALGLTDEQMADLAQQKLEEKIADQAAAADEAQQAFTDLYNALALFSAGFDDAAVRGDAFAAALERINAQGDELQESQETVTFADRLRDLGDAIDEIKDSDLEGLDLVPDTWEEVLNMPEELRPVLDALSQFRDSVTTEMTEAFASGGDEGVREWAQNTRTAIVDQLKAAGIESQEQINQILSALGLLPPQVETTIKISKEEEARSIIGNLSSVISQLPTDVQVQVAVLAETDPLAAIRLIIDELQKQGIEVPIQLIALLDQAESDVQGFASTPRTTTITGEADTKTADDDIKAFVGPDRTVSTVLSLTNGLAFDELINIHTADETIRVDLATGFINLPSASELAARIGTVRVPIDLYVRNVPRIDGVRN